MNCFFFWRPFPLHEEAIKRGEGVAELGCYSSGGRAGRVVIGGFQVQIPAPPTCMYKCPWARHWTPNCFWWAVGTLHGSLFHLCVCVCVRIGEYDKCCKVLWAVSRLEKRRRNSSPIRTGHKLTSTTMLEIEFDLFRLSWHPGEELCSSQAHFLAAVGPWDTISLELCYHVQNKNVSKNFPNKNTKCPLAWEWPAWQPLSSVCVCVCDSSYVTEMQRIHSVVLDLERALKCALTAELMPLSEAESCLISLGRR